MRQPHSARRNGLVARLPKPQRDMVNRMLLNSVPYKNIAAALDNLGFTLSERNISNWATGSFLDWRLQNEHALSTLLDQDHLTDHLRRDDATDLAEVGLQAAATRLSQLLLRQSAADDLENRLPSFALLVGLLCRLTREINTLQNQRDASRRALGEHHDPARLKEMEEVSTLETERDFSNPPPDYELPKPPQPPYVPPNPLSAELDEEEKAKNRQREHESLQSRLAFLHALTGKTRSPSAPQSSIENAQSSILNETAESAGAPAPPPPVTHSNPQKPVEAKTPGAS